MPLVTCPDCGHQVSTAAATCPQCNRPLTPQLAAPALGTLGAPAAEQIVWEGVPSLKAMIVEFAVTALYAIVLPIFAALAFDPLLSLVAGLGGARRATSSRPTARRSRPVVILLVVVVVGLRAVKLAAHMTVLRSHRYRVSYQRILIECGALSKPDRRGRQCENGRGHRVQAAILGAAARHRADRHRGRRQGR